MFISFGHKLVTHRIKWRHPLMRLLIKAIGAAENGRSVVQPACQTRLAVKLSIARSARVALGLLRYYGGFSKSKVGIFWLIN